MNRADIEMTNGEVYEYVRLVTPVADFGNQIGQVFAAEWIEVADDNDGDVWLQVRNISGIKPRATL